MIFTTNLSFCSNNDVLRKLKGLFLRIHSVQGGWIDWFKWHLYSYQAFFPGFNDQAREAGSSCDVAVKTACLLSVRTICPLKANASLNARILSEPLEQLRTQCNHPFCLSKT